MTNYVKSAHWGQVENKLFPYQVGFTSPPHDFDAAPSDFCRMAPETVGVHGRLLHVPVYDHALDQRADNFHLLEEVVHCMANGGADVVGQVGTNWVHAGGTDCVDIEAFCSRISETYQTPFHMAGLTLVQALRELDIERVHRPQVVTGFPRAVEQRGKKVSVKRTSGYALESGGDLSDSQLTGLLQPAEGRNRIHSGSTG